MAATVTVNDVLDGHVDLDLECPDRIYLNGYVPNLQVSGQVVSFMTAHQGYPIPSPAIMEKLSVAFRRAVQRFAADNEIPMARFGKDDRKIELMRPYLAGQACTGRSGVAAIGLAQEFQNVFASVRRLGNNGVPWVSFYKADRRVTCVLFLAVWDADFGPAFIKICTWFPYPIKVWLNGHEWAKRQATKAGIGFSELSNGFASCADPAALQAICDRLGPGAITVFFERWMSQLRWAALCGLLHQTARPTAASPARRRPATRATTITKSIAHTPSKLTSQNASTTPGSSPTQPENSRHFSKS